MKILLPLAAGIWLAGAAACGCEPGGSTPSGPSGGAPEPTSAATTLAELARFPRSFTCDGRLVSHSGDPIRTSPEVKFNFDGRVFDVVSNGKPMSRSGISYLNSQVIQSYRADQTRYFIMTTPPTAGKIDHTVFAFINPEGEGTLQLRRLSTRVGVSFYHLECQLVGV